MYRSFRLFVKFIPILCYFKRADLVLTVKSPSKVAALHPGSLLWQNFVSYVARDFFVFTIVLRKNYSLHFCSVCSQHFLFTSTHWKNKTSPCDLSSQCYIRMYQLPTKSEARHMTMISPAHGPSFVTGVAWKSRLMSMSLTRSKLPEDLVR